jgi:hypothetical protein
MLFKDKLEEKKSIIRPEIDRLLNLALKNQSHPGDLLLFHINGFYSDMKMWNLRHPNNKLDPHLIGPGVEGHSEMAHHKFIAKYRSRIHGPNYSDYVAQFIVKKWTKAIGKRNEKLLEAEEISIQLEMLIYLKFWEADMIIKKLTQFVRILNGESYDWYFKIAESSRDTDSSGTRQNLLREQVRNKIEPYSRVVYEIIKDTYKTQIRNSIAHSNYSFIGRAIHPNNFIKNDPHSQIQAISFDEWVDIFHCTLILHNEYLRMNNVINQHYARIAADYDNTMEILITDKSGKQYPAYVEYRLEFEDWKYKR